MTHIRKRAFICSRYRADSDDEVKRNIAMAEQACKLCAQQGYAPFAPHLLYTRFFNDEDIQEREMSILSGLSFLTVCDELWVIRPVDGYTSTGMAREIGYARACRVPVRMFVLDGTLKEYGTNVLPPT